jgi:hypothetical protein
LKTTTSAIVADSSFIDQVPEREINSRNFEGKRRLVQPPQETTHE